MKTMKNILFALTSLISIMVGIVLLFAYLTQDTYENHFADYEQMMASGLMEKG